MRSRSSCKSRYVRAGQQLKQTTDALLPIPLRRCKSGLLHVLFSMGKRACRIEELRKKAEPTELRAGGLLNHITLNPRCACSCSYV